MPEWINTCHLLGFLLTPNLKATSKSDPLTAHCSLGVFHIICHVLVMIYLFLGL